MNSMTSTRIMDLAEAYIRKGGSSSFSFRDIAADIGLKSSSIHYHFATKDDLISSVAHRYVESFEESLKALKNSGHPPKQLLDMYVAGFREEMVASDTLCLCGRLAAEVEFLPSAAREALRRYFEFNIEWLCEQIGSYAKQDPKSKAVYKKALKTLSACHGGHVIAKALQNEDAFDQTVSDMKKMWLS